MNQEVNHLYYLILTRFNLFLWRQDKTGNKVRTANWLEHRFGLFERFCLSSVASQTCKDFVWIVLFDSRTPENFKERIGAMQAKCPQLRPVFVAPDKGRYFAEIFQKEVQKAVDGTDARVLTTYLDNDDALDIHFVEDIRRRASTLLDGTFISYDDGYQYYTDHQYAMRIHYPRNHFLSVVEGAAPLAVKTIYGYGSHYYIDRIPNVRIERVSNRPMWCEVIHEKNMGNDAYFLNARMVKDPDLLRRDFSVEEKVTFGVGLYVLRFLPRYAKTFVRRIGYKLFGRKW